MSRSCSRRKSASLVISTRPWECAKRSCDSSSALSKPAWGVVVASMPRRRSPSAIAVGTFSSRWKRIIAGIRACQPLQQFRRSFRPHGVGKLLVLPHRFSYLLLVIVIVRQCRVHVGQGNLRKLSDNFVGRQPLALVPNDYVRDANAMPGDAGFSAADSRRGFDMFGNDDFNHDSTCKREIEQLLISLYRPATGLDRVVI